MLYQYIRFVWYIQLVYYLLAPIWYISLFIIPRTYSVNNGIGTRNKYVTYYVHLLRRAIMIKL